MKKSFLFATIILSFALTQCNSGGGGNSSPAETDPSNTNTFKGGLKIENIKAITFLENGKTITINRESNTTSVTITEGSSTLTYTAVEPMKIENETKNQNGYFSYDLTIPDTSASGNTTCKFNPQKINITLTTQATSPMGGYDIIGSTTLSTTVTYATDKTILLSNGHGISINTVK